MKGWRLGITCAIALWVAGGFQEALAPRLSVAGATPDFFLVVIGVLGILCSRRGGAYLGFAAGLLEGALAGANLGPYVISRTVVAFACASIAGLEFESNKLVAASVTAISTIAAQVILMFLSPPGGIVHFLFATIGAAVANAVLAIPLHTLVKRLSDPYTR